MLPPLPVMVVPGPPCPPPLLAKALGTGAIPSELAVILVAHSKTVRDDRIARTSEVRSGRVIHSFLAELALEVDLVPSLERVTMVLFDPDVRVLLMHLLFSVWFNISLPAWASCLSRASPGWWRSP